MKQNILIAVILLLSLGANSQINISYSLGYGSFGMGDMKDNASVVLQRSIYETGGLDIKQTDNYPNYFIHSGEITYQLRKHEFGINGAYMTTGAKFAYSDYSGKLDFKIIPSAYKLGLVYKFHFFTTAMGQNLFSLFAELSPSVVLTSVKIEGHEEYYDSGKELNQKEELLSNEFGFSIQPMLGCRLKVINHLTFHAGVGYDFELGSKLNPNQRIDWSGFRVKAGVGVSF